MAAISNLPARFLLIWERAGSKNKERILENLGADKVSFTDEEFTALETALAGCKIYGHRGHVEMEGKGFLNKKPLR